ncbi:MAG: hypothetical protein L3J47_08735 [Sulfurovum sp.]|nr:hypothetical protein [Sulfurovum sp.]
MKRRSLLLSMATIPLLIGCGGGGTAETDISNPAGNTASSTITGTVPGTFIEAFCEDGSYHSTSSTQNGTNQHPFSLQVPTEKACRIVMTTNENDDANRVITPISFNGHNTIRVNKDIDIGHIPLALSPNDIPDTNGDHVSDVSKNVVINDTTLALSDDTPVMDNNHNGIVDVYEDNDHDGTVDAYDDDNHNGIPDIHDDSDDDEIPDAVAYVNNSGNTNGGYTLTAWNDLGMHCMDGNDFSVFSILPPYNNLHAQLKDKNGGLVTSGVIITYEATTGTDGKINTSSNNKTNFWQYADKLFGVVLAADTGLTGKKTPSTTPQTLTFNATHGWWEAEGIPITPYNDDGSKNYYPLVKVVAKDAQGNILATANTVLPVSDEMDCKRCHASNSLADAKPSAGWANNPDPEKDFKFNILRLHDDKFPSAVSDYLTLLQQKGYDYNASGLEATAQNGTPILCAACHKSNALPNVGIGWEPGVNIKAFTAAMHGLHAMVKDPENNMMLLGDSNNRSACYACHPGSQTKCLRGAMGDAKDANGNNAMQCQSCHGDMHAVGDATREGWLDEPNCQACHYKDANGNPVRDTSAVLANGTLRSAVNSNFATLPNTPMQGYSLYRFSKGHGGLQCEACHGATHAIYPAHTADNLLSQGIQGHSGTIGECSACHASIPNTINGGPHGMHPVGQSWVEGHEHAAEQNAAQCKACHGQDYRGSVLSKTWTTRSFSTEWGQKNFAKGHQVSCYDCHNGPNGD